MKIAQDVDQNGLKLSKYDIGETHPKLLKTTNEKSFE